MEILNGFLEFLQNLISQNESAVLSLPSELKTILVITIVICLGSSLIRKASKFIEVMICVTIAYVLAANFGLI